MEEARSEPNIEQIIRETHAYLCNDCSKCTGSCPIGRTGSIYSPRALVQHLTLDGKHLSEAELWRCLTCGLCRERCPSDVDYPGFIRRLREHAVQSGSMPQKTHGGAIKEIMRIMTVSGIRQKRTGWLPKWVKTVGSDEADRSATDLYFVGCAPYFDVIFEDFALDLVGTHAAALELLRSHRVRPAVLADERCCGHDALWAGDTDLFRKLAAQNVRLFKQAGAERVFVSCPEGYYTFTHDYPRYLGESGIEFVNTVKFIADKMTIQEPKQRIDGWGVMPRRQAPTSITTAPPTTVTYHDSCRMGRFSGLYAEPRKLLELADGVILKEMEFNRENAPCCGSNLWINCDCISKKIQIELLDAAGATQADVVITSCDKCRIHLACAQMDDGHIENAVRTENILRFLHGKEVRKA